MKQVQQQHVDFYRKRLLRRALLRLALPGAAYVPFIGDGDLAVELYHDRHVYGADLDEERLARCENRDTWPSGITLKRHNCNQWPFETEALPPLAIADFDAYSDPYESFRAFWRAAPKADTLVLYFTDGHRQGIIRTGNLIAPDGTHTKVPVREKRALYNFYWKRVVAPWFGTFIIEAGWRVRATNHYLRGSSMLYWGAVVERRP